MVESNNNARFAWSLVSCFYPAQAKSSQTSSYPDYRKNCPATEIDFPVTLQ